MTTEVLTHLLRVNLVGGVAILVVLALRMPVRRWFGPETSYLLWAVPPLCAIATLLPARSTEDVKGAGALASAVAGISAPALTIWVLGVVVFLFALTWMQARFAGALKAGRAGPAVIGIIAPRIVMPADDGTYTSAERSLIRAHEREHVARRDPRAAAGAAFAQALCWFNPLVHVAAHVMRLDQELACDAAVLRRRPNDRCLYAKTLLKSQLATQALPFGCHWPPRAQHPLEIRIALLRDARRHDGMLGQLLIAGLLVAGSLTAWSVQPPVPRHPPLQLRSALDRGPTMSVLLISRPRTDTEANIGSSADQSSPSSTAANRARSS